MHGLPESPFELPANEYLERLSAASARAGIVNSQGMVIEFVEALPLGATSYESMIFRSGKVPTRLTEVGATAIDVVHDYLNALMWFAWPKTKAALNAAQFHSAKVLVSQSVASNSQRGSHRDRLTLLDESGVAVVCTKSLGALFKARQWTQLFYDHRDAISRGDFQVFVLGHGLLQRLQAPFKSITAHAWVFEDDGTIIFHEGLDGRMAAQVPDLGRSHPLPVMGLPGWHRSWLEGEQNAAFYNDQNVFRVPI
jgi:hypothetical protein